MERYAILLADAVAKKRPTLLFGRIQGKATRTNVAKGELVVADSDYGYYTIFHLESDQAVTLCTEGGLEIAFLTDYEVMLLKAIASPLNRYGVYCSQKCAWGRGLKLDDVVSVCIPLLDVWVSCIIRYIGKIDGYPGTMFGVEIMDGQYSSCGTTNGTWRGKSLFHCKPNAGRFVSLDMMSELPEGASNISGKNSSSHQPSQVCGVGALEPSHTSDKSITQKSVPLSTARAGHHDKDEMQGFELGSLVQVIDPPLYGVIRAMGEFPKIEGIAAGIELDAYKKGCTDGTWCKTRYFRCPRGRAFFCSMSNLKIDQRFTDIDPTIDSSQLNPLRDYPLEEPEDQPIRDDQIVKYLGDCHGIQGHYNSCYLDTTVFGLFALSDAFDPMLQTEARDPAGEKIRRMLWRGIVNPLRKNGVVRHESVMTLRNKLEELGKIKRINQEEKDPEEFLNMLFKHALNAETFISIKRPYGIEEEFFVQLFLEPDESLELPPTVGQLLTKMFKEQNISFTEAPNKLLIQIPRYGKQFKTYEKVIPDLQLATGDLMEPPGCCHVCNEPAWKTCSECAASSDGQPTYFCDSCCSRVHSGCCNVPGSTDIHNNKEGADCHSDLELLDLAEFPGSTSTDIHCNKEVVDGRSSLRDLQLLSVICIETSHYVCFTRSIAQNQWIFFDSMADRVYNEYNIPKGVECTKELNEWVYSGDQRLQSTPYRRLPELVRRFTHDIYLCVYTC